MKEGEGEEGEGEEVEEGRKGGRELSQECCELTEQGDHSIINKAW